MLYVAVRDSLLIPAIVSTLFVVILGFFCSLSLLEWKEKEKVSVKALIPYVLLSILVLSAGAILIGENLLTAHYEYQFTASLSDVEPVGGLAGGNNLEFDNGKIITIRYSADGLQIGATYEVYYDNRFFGEYYLKKVS